MSILLVAGYGWRDILGDSGNKESSKKAASKSRWKNIYKLIITDKWINFKQGYVFIVVFM